MSSAPTATPIGKSCGKPGGTNHYHRIDTPGGGQPLRCPPPGIIMITMPKRTHMWAHARTLKPGESKPKGGCHVDNHCSRNLPDLGCDPESAGARMVNCYHASPHRLRGTRACRRFPRYRVRCIRNRATMRVNAPSCLTERAYSAKRGCRLLLRCEEGGSLLS